MNVPAEAAQLNQMVTDAFRGSQSCNEDPLHGHPRYQAVQDLSRCAAASPHPCLPAHHTTTRLIKRLLDLISCVEVV